nr:transposase [uncultured Flavobacterium sp.]
MPLFKNKYKTESNRLKNWDYSNEGIYFITIVTQNRESIFGYIEEDKMILNENGQIVENELLKSITIRKNWFFHNWVVMPNHIHLLIEIQNINQILTKEYIVETHSCASPPSISTIIAETHCCASLQKNESGSKLSRKPNSISSFVAIFKSVTTKQINGFDTIWQSNYHDHIVRNYKTFDKIYQYIKSNPGNWNTDSINPNFK